MASTFDEILPARVWESFIHFECSIIIDWFDRWDNMTHECILWNQLYPTSFVPWFSELGLVTYFIRWFDHNRWVQSMHLCNQLYLR